MSLYSKDAAGSAKRYRRFRWFPHSNSSFVGQLFHPSRRTSCFFGCQLRARPPLVLEKSPQ
ncbi:hypothetical protein SV7mr_47010 [Stieleria bergensis]|uniref:Uncharacterized protein n=1 Tax=Stieleria bergensis TaxID=2528025 RepID=A0A517T187_9BACT|nr:hypothetical protein SV7mr_47010 [Planctomycetes bacterium SV_7m_r]